MGTSIRSRLSSNRPARTRQDDTARAVAAIAGVFVAPVWGGNDVGLVATYEIVAIAGQAAPGIPGATFAEFRDPVTNPDGGIAVVASVTGGGATPLDDTGLWYRGADDPGWTLAVRAGDAVAGATLGSLNQPTSGLVSPFLSVGGNAVLQTQLRRNTGGVTTGNDDVIVAVDGLGAGPLSLIWREGDPAPGTSGAVFGVVDNPLFLQTRVSATGEVAFEAALAPGIGDSTDGNDTGLWGLSLSGVGTGLGLVAREGDPVGVGGVYGSFVESRERSLSDGWSSFVNVRTGVPASSNTGVLGARPNPDGAPFQGIAELEGEEVPWVPGALFSSFSGVSSNGALDTAFTAQIRDAGGGGVSASNDTGLWVYRGSGPSMPTWRVLREGEAAPGLGGALFGNGLWTEFVINTRGDVGLSHLLQIGPGGVSGDDSFTVWVTRDLRLTTPQDAPATLRLIAREGDPAPGTGGVFATPMTRPAMNANGLAVFRARVQTDGGPENGLFAYDPRTDRVSMVLLEGELIDVDPEPEAEDLARVSRFVFGSPSGGEDGLPVLLSDSGELVVAVSLLGRGDAVLRIGLDLACQVDLNADGTADILDVVAFLAFWNAGSPLGNFDPDPAINILDVLAFVTAWADGC